MADPQHIAKLREGVDAWNRWRESNWNVKPDLSGLDLPNEKGIKSTELWDQEARQLNISYINFGWTNLTGANLRGVNLEEAILEESNLVSANLQGASLSGAKLHAAILSNANLREANLIRAELSTTNLSGADLRFAHLSGADLRQADLSGADLRSAQLGAANLQNAILKGADLWVANLNGADLTDANLEDTNLIRTSLHSTNLTRANLYNADLRDADLQAANLEHSGLIGITYERRFMRGKYQGIRGVESSFGDAIFRRDALDQDYIDTMTSRWRRSPMIVVLWLWSLIDYGRSLGRILWIAALFVVAFGFVYAVQPEAVTYTVGFHNWFTPYYSSLVTFTSLGFSNDVAALNGLGQALLTMEVLLGYFILGVLISILLQKISRRS